MVPKILDKEKHTNPKTGCLCRYVRSDTEYFRYHSHNYYEIFIVLSGKVCHVVNGQMQYPEVGQLLFIRDFDIHDYKSGDGNSFEFINLAFHKEIFYDVYKFLGNKFPYNELMGAKLPPSVMLSKREKEKMLYSMTELEDNKDSETTKMKLKALLVNLFMNYFLDYKEPETEIPLWLELTYEKMKKPENFIAGASRMYEISKKSREHLCRSLKKYYNTTVHDYVNELRLRYAARLLTASNLSATEICYECGFENISWFYKTFYKKYGHTPGDYRKRNSLM